MRKLCLSVLVLVVCVAARPAFGILQFMRVFDEVYLKEHPDKDFVKEAKSPKMRCLVCHQGKLRKNHNPYGIHLVELLDKKADIRKPDKVKEALAKVGEMHSDPEDDKSPTYDELIKKSIFPGGTLEEASKEPEPTK